MLCLWVFVRSNPPWMHATHVRVEKACHRVIITLISKRDPFVNWYSRSSPLQMTLTHNSRVTKAVSSCPSVCMKTVLADKWFSCREIFHQLQPLVFTTFEVQSSSLFLSGFQRETYHLLRCCPIKVTAFKASVKLSNCLMWTLGGHFEIWCRKSQNMMYDAISYLHLYHTFSNY